MYQGNNPDNFKQNLICQDNQTVISTEQPIYVQPSINDSNKNLQQNINTFQQYNFHVNNVQSNVVTPHQNINIHRVSPQFSPTNIPASDNPIHVVRLLSPTERVLKGEMYAYVKCPNVTTMWIENSGFSYLSKYTNDQNYFFLPLKKTGFSLETWNESFTKNKVDRSSMQQFVTNVNNEGKVIQSIQLGNKITSQNICCYTV